jgi:endonuclease/exonuclease/phosphatase family metal-dependent hydrolase
LPEFDPQFRFIIPLQLTSTTDSFTLFAVWAMNNKENRIARYIGQVWFAINNYFNLLDKPTIIIGDFNSNKIWDYKDRVVSHSDVVDKLQEKEIRSVYHQLLDIEQGKELHPTFYMFRKNEKPYHIDYCFASQEIIKKIKSIEIGKYEDWISISDHMPLTIELEF